MGTLRLVTALLRQLLQSRAELVAENLALRHQLAVLRRSVKCPRLHRRGRIFWVWLSRLWGGWRSSPIGSIRRGCLDHILVISEAHLRRVLREYFAYSHDSRPHQSLGGNASRPREVEPPSQGRIVAEPQVGGLHHRYRRAA